MRAALLASPFGHVHTDCLPMRAYPLEMINEFEYLRIGPEIGSFLLFYPLHRLLAFRLCLVAFYLFLVSPLATDD